MVKKHGNLWNKIIDYNNLELAFEKASRKKEKYGEVIAFEKDKEYNLIKIRESLINKTFKTAKYRQKRVFEPKERIIYILPFSPDRIIQHALMNVLIPIFENLFIKDSYACIKYRGQHKGSKRCTEFVKKNKYCLKCDIRKFYPSINQSILMNLLKRKIKCKDTLWLLENIVFSFNGDINVPIGNLTSQWFGNFYLTELDRFVKQELKIKSYLRYCDDFCLFNNDKKYLHYCKYKIEKFLKEKLDLNFSKCDIFKVIQGVDFLGYRHFNNYTLLRKSTAKRIIKRIRKLPDRLKSGNISIDYYRSAIASTYGWLKHANTYNLRKKLKIHELLEELQNNDKGVKSNS